MNSWIYIREFISWIYIREFTTQVSWILFVYSAPLQRIEFHGVLAFKFFPIAEDMNFFYFWLYFNHKTEADIGILLLY